MSNPGSKQVWGPYFWTVLHTFAECVGYQTDPILSSDEAEAWIVLLKTQVAVMPCPVCKQHYAEWLRTHRVDRLREIHGFVRYQWLQKLLWDLHEQVRKRSSTETSSVSSVTLDQLPTVYPRNSLNKTFYSLGEMFTWALEHQQLQPHDIHKWKAAAQRLRTMYSI